MKSNKGWSFGYVVLILVLLAGGYYFFFLTDAQKDALDLKLGLLPSSARQALDVSASPTVELGEWFESPESAVCYDFSGGFLTVRRPSST